jgi:hypothetical protein
VGGRWGDFEGNAKLLVSFEGNLLDQASLFGVRSANPIYHEQ